MEIIANANMDIMKILIRFVRFVTRCVYSVIVPIYVQNVTNH